VRENSGLCSANSEYSFGRMEEGGKTADYMNKGIRTNVTKRGGNILQHQGEGRTGGGRDTGRENDDGRIERGGETFPFYEDAE